MVFWYDCAPRQHHDSSNNFQAKNEYCETSRTALRIPTQTGYLLLLSSVWRSDKHSVVVGFCGRFMIPVLKKADTGLDRLFELPAMSTVPNVDTALSFLRT